DAVTITNADANASKPTAVNLTDTLSANTNLCVKETFTDNQGKILANAYSSPVTVTAAVAATAGSPTIASASAGAKTVAVTSPVFPDGAKSATYDVYAV